MALLYHLDTNHLMSGDAFPAELDRFFGGNGRGILGIVAEKLS